MASPPAPGRSTSHSPTDGERYNLTQIYQVPPPFSCGGTRMTPRRAQNLISANLERLRGAARVKAYPIKLTVEATNLCNLRCTACFTGNREVGRPLGHMSLELYERLLKELGPYLFEVDFFNWGEPLLAKHIYEMIELTHAAGVSTTVSTNFSFRFEADDAERLVRTGLSVLGVSLDGARQETYEQYRVGGDFARALENCRMVADAKRRLGSRTPHLVWEFHVFPHNVDDVDSARELAAEIGMEISVDKGWLKGPDWDPGGRFQYFLRPPPVPARCEFLWHHAVINNDGGVAPCPGAFYREHDVGKLETGTSGDGAKSFFEVWNGARQRASRGLFNSRGGPEERRALICHDCERTRLFEEWREYLGSDSPPGAFSPSTRLNVNDWVNYLWSKKPPGTPEARGIVPLRKKPRS